MARVLNGLFVALLQRDVRSAAFQALSAKARCAIIELDMSYWETNRLNPLVLTQRWLASRLKINPKTASHILLELETHWFLEPTRIGRLTGPNSDRGAEYRMTWLPTSDGVPATFDSRKWSPPIPSYDASRKGASTGRKTPLNAGTNGLQRTTFRHAGLSAREMLEQAKIKRGLVAAGDKAHAGNK